KQSEARELFEKALEAKSPLADYSLYYLAAIHFNAGNRDQARRLLSQLKQQYPQSVWHYPAALLQARLDLADKKYSPAGAALRKIRADKAAPRERALRRAARAIARLALDRRGAQGPGEAAGKLSRAFFFPHYRIPRRRRRPARARAPEQRRRDALQKDSQQRQRRRLARALSRQARRALSCHPQPQRGFAGARADRARIPRLAGRAQGALSDRQYLLEPPRERARARLFQAGDRELSRERLRGSRPVRRRGYSRILRPQGRSGPALRQRHPAISQKLGARRCRLASGVALLSFRRLAVRGGGFQKSGNPIEERQFRRRRAVLAGAHRGEIRRCGRRAPDLPPDRRERRGILLSDAVAARARTARRAAGRDEIEQRRAGAGERSAALAGREFSPGARAAA